MGWPSTSYRPTDGVTDATDRRSTKVTPRSLDWGQRLSWHLVISQPGSTTEIVPYCGSEHANPLLSRENTTCQGSVSSAKKGIRWMRVSHSFPAISATFDDPNLVSCAGLAPTMALAQRAGLTDLVAHTLTLKAKGGVNAHLKLRHEVARSE